MENLGRTLHLLQDMTSPPHVRNDAHPISSLLWGFPAQIYGTSGYENITASYVPSTVNDNIPIETIAEENILWYSKYKELTTFTNEHFLSEDTIPGNTPAPTSWRSFPKPYILPVTIDPITGQVNIGTLGYIKGDVVNKLVYVYLDIKTEQIKYKLDDDVHREYADVLMPKAISYTAGVIKYFLSLKGTGKVIIDNPADKTTVYSPSADISGHLTYYAASATVYYHAAGTWSRDHIEVPVTLDTTTGKYIFSTVTATNHTPISLISGDNKIEVVADNENVTATTANIMITYQGGGSGGGYSSRDTDDDDDDDED